MISLLADHEGIVPDIFEAVALVEAARTRIVDEDREIDLAGPSLARLIENPLHHGRSQTRALPGRQHVELAKLERGAVGRDRERDRTNLHEGHGLAAGLGEPYCEARVRKLAPPLRLILRGEESGEVLGRIKVTEGLGEAAGEKLAKHRRVLD